MFQRALTCASPRCPTARVSSLARAFSLTTLLACLVVAPRAARAQTLEDAELLPPRELTATVMYARDAWDQYWEGSLKRSNGNIGTVSTSSVSGTVGYGVNSRLSLFASLPYVSTEASQGVLHGMEGRQDFTLMAKYRVFSPIIAGRARREFPRATTPPTSCRCRSGCTARASRRAPPRICRIAPVGFSTASPRGCGAPT